MKRLLSSLATITLIGGSVANVVAFKQINQQQKIKDPTPKGRNWMASNEDVEDIAGKLFHKTIKLDPNTWLGKNLAADQAAVNAAIVKQGILTADEVQYVTWNSLQIKVAGWYWNEGFTVKKDGATATGSVAINAATGETTAQIAAKLSKATLKFNYDWWNGKSLKDNWAQISQIITNEHLLTKAETSVVTGLATYKTISGTGQFAIQMHVNDGNTDSIATPHINVVNDGLSADELANQLHTRGQYHERYHNDVYYLNGNAAGLYADNATVYKNLRTLLLNDHGCKYTQTQVNGIVLPHVKLTNGPNGNNVTGSVLIDGQTAKVTIQLVAYTSSFIDMENCRNNHLHLNVELAPDVINYLWSNYFSQNTNLTNCLSDFYQGLDDNDFGREMPSIGKWFVAYWDRLEAWMAVYGDASQTETAIVLGQSQTTEGFTAGYAANKAFAQALYNQIEAKAYTNDYLTVNFEWYYAYQDAGLDDIYTTQYWHIW